MVHGVVDREPGVDAAPGRVDVEEDVPLGVIGVQEEHLCDDDVGDLVVDGASEKHDPVHEKPAEDVVTAFPPACPLDYIGWVCRHAHVLLVDLVLPDLVLPDLVSRFLILRVVRGRR